VRLIGCDISHWELVPDWSKVETEFCITKATQGTDFRDSKFKEYWAGMKKAGIPRGSYHFLNATQPADGAAEAQFYLKVVDEVGGLKPGDLPYCCDMEAGSTAAGAAGFIAEIKKQKPGAKVMLYCSESVIPKRTFWQVLTATKKWAGADFLWVAHYGPVAGPDTRQWHIWQSSDGKVGCQPHTIEGIGNCDIDKLRGAKTLERMVV